MLASQTARRLVSRALITILAWALMSGVFASTGWAVTETDASLGDPQGTTSFQTNLTALGPNLFAPSTALLTTTGPVAMPGAADHTNTSTAVLTDGLTGTVPGTGGGGPAAVNVANGATITFTFDTSTTSDANGYAINEIASFSQWGDGGRFQQDYTLSYSTVANPTTFLTIKSVAYHPGGNSAFVDLTALALTNVKAVMFSFPTTQNGYVGYNELFASGTAIGVGSATWVGGDPTLPTDWGTGANWQGGVVPSGGTVVFGNAGATGVVDLGTADRSIAGASFLGLVSTTIGSTSGKSLILDGGANAVQVTVAGPNSITSAIKLNSNSTFQLSTNGVLTLSGPISEGVAGKSLTITGGGITNLAAVNSYTGGTNLNGGTTNVIAGALGTTGNIKFGGGILQYAAASATPEDYSGRIKNSASAVNLDVNGNTVTFASAIDSTNTAGLKLTSSAAGGIVNLNAANSYTGGTTIGANLANLTVNLGVAGALPNDTLTMNGGTLNLNALSTTVTALAGTGGTITDSSTGAATTGLTVNQGTNTTFAGSINNGTNKILSLTKQGAGNLTLTGTSNYTGGTTISAGTLQLGNGTVNGVIVGNILDNGALVVSNGINQTLSASSISGSGTFQKSGAGLLTLGGGQMFGGNSTLSGGILNYSTGSLGTTGNVIFAGGTLQYAAGTPTPDDLATRIQGSTSAISIDANGNTVVFANPLISSNTGGLTLSSTAAGGSLRLNGADAYTGATTINSGTLIVGNAAALGANNVTVNGGTLDLNGNSLALSNLAGTGGTITDNGTGVSTTTLTVNQTTATTYAGSINNGTNRTLALVKTGTGSLSLSGISNYGGGTTINGGTLTLAGATLSGSGPLTIGGNAATGSPTLAFSGSTTVAGTVTLNAAGTGAAGTLNAGVGTLNAGGLTLNGGTLNLTLGTAGAANAGTTYGTINVAGAITPPSSNTLTVNLNNNNGANLKGFLGAGTYKLFSFGSLGGVVNPATINIANPQPLSTYSLGLSGNNINLNVIAPSAVINQVVLPAGNVDAAIGLDTNKSYINVINFNTSTSVAVNNVIFRGVGTASGFNATAGNNAIGNNNSTTWSVTGTNAVYSGYTTVNNTGGLAALLSTFIYNGQPATVTLGGLTVGQTYVLTTYDASFGTAGTRNVTLSSSDGTVAAYDENIGNSPNSNLIRFTFEANGTSETLQVAPFTADTFHFYAMSTEQVFNNSWQSGANWTTAAWLNTGTNNTSIVPNYVGANANFTAQGAPTSIALDANITVGHIQFDGANSWTVTGTNTLTLQTDIGGVSVISALAGSHTIAAPVVLQNDAIKYGLGTVAFTNTVTSNNHILTVSSGTIQFGDGTANNGSFDGNIANNSVVAFANPNSQSYDKVMSGIGSVTKSAAGALTLTGANTYTGGTTVTAGTLLANNTTGSATGTGPVTISGGSLGGTGTINGGITIASGGHLAPGVAGVGTLTSGTNGTLTLSSGAQLDFNLDGTNQGTSHNAPGVSNRFASTSAAAGAIAFPTSGSVTLNAIGALPSVASGMTATYELFSYANAAAVANFVDQTNFTYTTQNTLNPVQLGSSFATAPSTYSFSLVNDPTAGGIFLDISNAFSSFVNGTWTGAMSAQWQDDGNWNPAKPSGAGAAAIFNGAGAGSPIVLGQDRTIGSLQLSVANYTIGSNTFSSLILDNTGNTGNATITASGGMQIVAAPVAVSNTNLDINVSSGSLMLVGGLTNSGSRTVNLNEANSAVLGVGDVTNNGTLNAATGTSTVGNVTGNGSTTVANNAQLTAKQFVQGSLTVHGDSTHTTAKATVTASGANSAGDPNQVSVLNSLSIDNDGAALGSRNYYGTVDLKNNDIIINNASPGAATTTLASVADMARAGQSGNGLMTSSGDTITGLGVINNTNGLTTFDNVSINDNATLVKYTFFGDLNLDGKVDGNEIAAAVNGFNLHLGGWANGDANYSGQVDGNDIAAIVNAFNGQNGHNAPLPEPSTLVLAGLGLLGLLFARKRRAK
jgi:autotransporter-associated beta strand protein